MIYLLIPAVLIVGAWAWGVSKVGTPPPAHDPEKPIDLSKGGGK